MQCTEEQCVVCQHSRYSGPQARPGLVSTFSGPQLLSDSDLIYRECLSLPLESFTACTAPQSSDSYCIFIALSGHGSVPLLQLLPKYPQRPSHQAAAEAAALRHLHTPA